MYELHQGKPPPCLHNSSADFQQFLLKTSHFELVGSAQREKDLKIDR